MAGDDVPQSKPCGGYCGLSKLIQTIVFLTWTALGVAFIVVGAMNIFKCPEERFIPIYMVVAGAFSFAYWILLPLRCFFPTIGKILGLPIALFVFAWFIAGSVWVFRRYQVDPSKIRCDTHMYLFVFSILLIQWILIGIGIIGILLSCFFCKNSCIPEFFSCFDCCPCLEESMCLDCCKACPCLDCEKISQCLDCGKICQCLDCCNICQCLDCCKICQCLDCCKNCQCLDCSKTCQCLESCTTLCSDICCCCCQKCCKSIQCSSCFNCLNCCKCLECCASKA
ncbi:uncharacterized protein [Pyxicephalus adspersus]|uniref:uncharacterized protein n=1 Tax=Pyxicephalus adspersus TaxID=30357 RepID=UPI003B5CE6E6